MTRRPPLQVIEGGNAGRAPTPALQPALELAALGTALTLASALMGRLPTWFRDLGTFQSLYVVAFALYALALLRLRRYAAIPYAGWAVLAVALATRAALLPMAPSLSDDLYRYVWEGTVAAHGGDPYRQSPLDPALEPLRDREVYPRINHKELTAIYPPLAIVGFATVAKISATVTAMKLWVVLHDLLLVWLLLAWTRGRGLSPVAVIAYAWNPLVLVEYAGSGHNEPTALVWLVLALMWVEKRPGLSALALAAAALVKLAPLVTLPFLLRRWPWRARLLCLVLLGTGLTSYWVVTRGPESGLAAYWSKWRNNELLFHYLERGSGSFDAARAISLAVIAAAIVLAWHRHRRPEAAARLATRMSLLAGPVLHPWYLGWALVFEPLAPSAPWLLLSLTATLNYGLFTTPPAGHQFHLPLEWRWVEYGIPLLAVLAIAVSRRWRGVNSKPEA